VAAVEQACDGPTDTLRSPVERALAELGMEWKNVIAFGLHSDRVLVIEGPVGHKRTYVLRGDRKCSDE
jgi:hypothetical protein